MKSFVMSCFLGMLLLQACEKKEVPPDVTPPEIIFLSPEPYGDTYSGDSLRIVVALKDNRKLGKYAFKMIELVNSLPIDTVLDADGKVGGEDAEFEIQTIFFIDTVPRYYELQMKLEDFAGNRTNRSIYQYVVSGPRKLL